MLFALALAAQAQPYLNLDFEISTRGRIRGWPLSYSGFEVAADSTDKVSGTQRLRIRNAGAPETAIAPPSILLPLGLVRGRRLKVSGWIKTDSVTPGCAAIWLRVDGAKWNAFA